MNIAFDTLKLADRLSAGGFTGEQAKTVATALSEAFTDAIVTKADLLQATDRLDAKIDALDAKLDARSDALDAKFDAKIDALDAKFDAKIDALDAKFDAKFDALELRMTVKLGAMLVVGVGVMAALMKLLH